VEFDLTYTTEQEEFRKEVRSWLSVNGKMPSELGEWPLNDRDVTRAQFEWKKAFRQKLGHQGWLYPTLPTNYGGGGLTLDHDIIIKEELQPYGPVSASSVAVAALYVYGTEEQKQNLLKPLLRGDTEHWLLWTEPDAGVDLASVKTRAIKDGDDFVVNGVKCYISGLFEPDYMWLLAVTDPDAPRHANAGHFFMPANLPGISMQFMELINRGTQHFVWFEDVRVPREYLIGGETQGWQVAQTSLELEHGAEGSLNGRVSMVDDLIRELNSGKVRTGQHGDAVVETLVTTLICEKINKLISRRNFWMFRAKQPMSYYGS
jgi:alkylation response protein AidB-like acyl-CoA dehydrogenase